MGHRCQPGRGISLCAAGSFRLLVSPHRTTSMVGAIRLLSIAGYCESSRIAPCTVPLPYVPVRGHRVSPASIFTTIYLSAIWCVCFRFFFRSRIIETRERRDSKCSEGARAFSRSLSLLLSGRSSRFSLCFAVSCTSSQSW